MEPHRMRPSWAWVIENAGASRSRTCRVHASSDTNSPLDLVKKFAKTPLYAFYAQVRYGHDWQSFVETSSVR